MKREKNVFLMVFCLALLATLGFQGTGFAVDPATINPDTYPQMDDREVGHMRYYFKIADQALGDFDHMKSPNINMIPGTGDLQFRESAYRYQLAFIVYFLATEQYHKLSACTGIIKPKMDRLIQKMLHRDVWKYWGEWVSKGLFVVEPDLDLDAYPERHDPIADDNVMYSAHLSQMIGLYEKLYKDLKWSQPGSMVFKWSDTEQFTYDLKGINDALLRQSLSPQICIECEPNFCFPMCNTHPMLSYKLHDQVHGTNYFSQTYDRYMDWFYAKGMISPTTHEVGTFYLVKQDITVIDDNIEVGNILDLVVNPLVKSGLIYGNLAASDGWNGYFMHGFSPDVVERNYQYWMDNHIVDVSDDLADVTVDRFEDQLGLGFFAMLMSEMGQTAMRDRMMNMAERRYSPIWLPDGTYEYPFFADFMLSGGPLSRFTANGLTGKLMANALATPPGGVAKMYNEPFIGAIPTTPRVTNVKFPTVIMRRAIWDPDKKALIVTTEDPWEKINFFWEKTSFTVERLDPTKKYILRIDGRNTATYTGKTSISVSVALLGRHNIILAQQ